MRMHRKGMADRGDKHKQKENHDGNEQLASEHFNVCIAPSPVERQQRQTQILTEKLRFVNCLMNGLIHASSCLFPPFIIPLKTERNSCDTQILL